MSTRPARWTRRQCMGLPMLGLLAPMTAGAVVLTPIDASAIRTVVQAQLDAFAADDAERAFAFASKEIQAQFGDAVNFMSMVRGGYPMVVRPLTVSFFVPQAQASGTAGLLAARQDVQLRDREGRLWLASYAMERQAGAGWRINGCTVVADSGKSMA